ncbi:hypothetical protein CB0101_05340 [Synechococcus sp. CB0101]|uniref:glycosyltransferase n=1 Tax=Synechococcus sp. CB0101 TaxID=232348 RepID=UPI0008FEDD1E|nr:hypothetical protein CB0101_05340 [Synechococcus sp. CB0101]
MTLKIAFVLPTIHVKAGGPPKVVFNICEGLSKIGYEIDVYCLSMIGKYGPIDITNNNKSINFKIFDASSLFCEKIGYCKKLVNSFHENIHNYDIVHIHCVWEHFLLKIARLCFKNNIPYVISPHGMLDNFELRKSAFQKKLWSNVFQLQKNSY